MKKKILVRDNHEYDFKELVKMEQKKAKKKSQEPSKFIIHQQNLDHNLYQQLYTFDPQKEIARFVNPLQLRSQEIENENFIIKARLKKMEMEQLGKKASLNDNECENQNSSINFLIRKLFKDKNKFKKSKIQNAQYEDNVVQEHMKLLITGEDAIAFFAKYGNTTPVKFIHCVRDCKYPDNPYKLKIVHNHNELTKVGEYYTVSPSGIVHIFSNCLIDKKESIATRKPTEFISLSDWMKESTQFNILSNIHFFKHFLPYKVLLTWRKNQKKIYFLKTRQRIQREVFYCKPAYSKFIFEIKGQLQQIQLYEMVNFNSQQNALMEFETFKSIQNDTRKKTGHSYVSIFEEILSILHSMVAKIQESKNENFESFQSHNFVNSLVKKKPLNLIKKEKQEKLKRKELSQYDFDLLGRFICFVNYLCLENLINTNLASLIKLKDEIYKERKNGLFTTSPNFNETSVQFTNKEEDMVKEINFILEENIKVVKEVPKIFGNQAFDAFIDQIWSHEERDQFCPDIKHIIENSHEYQSNKELIRSRIESDFKEALKKVESNMSYFRKIENEKNNFNPDEWILTQPSLEQIKVKILQMKEYKKESNERIKDYYQGILHINSQMTRDSMLDFINECNKKIVEYLYQFTKKEVQQTLELFLGYSNSLQIEAKTLQNYSELITNTNKVSNLLEEIESKKLQIEKMQKLLKQVNYIILAEDKNDIESIFKIQDNMSNTLASAQQTIEKESEHFKQIFEEKEEEIKDLIAELKFMYSSEEFSSLGTPVSEALRKLEIYKLKYQSLDELYQTMVFYSKQMTFPFSQDIQNLGEIKKELMAIDALWHQKDEFLRSKEAWFENTFKKLDIKQIGEQIKRIVNYCEENRGSANPVAKDLIEKVEEIIEIQPIVNALGNPHMKPSHWSQIFQSIPEGAPLMETDDFTLNDLLKIGVKEHMALINEITVVATEEHVIKNGLQTIKNEWLETQIPTKPFREYKSKFVITDEIVDLIERIDTDLLKIQSMLNSKYIKSIKEEVEEWQRRLSIFFKSIEEWLQLQKSWMYLENVFSAPDIQKSLPNEYSLFHNIDQFWLELMEKVNKKPLINEHISNEYYLNQFKESNKQLEVIMKNLEEYLDLKRNLFPRFYFLSNDELLEIFSQTTNPEAVQPHLRKCFDNIKRIKINNDEKKPRIVAMISADPDNDQEEVEFISPIIVEGPVESWLLRIEDEMRASLYSKMDSCLKAADSKGVMSDKELFFRFPAQVVLAVDMIRWTDASEAAICLKNLASLQTQMNEKIKILVELITQDLTIGQRELIKSMMVLDVHNRDVTDQLSEEQVRSVNDFLWKKQLRYYWEVNQTKIPDESQNRPDCFIKQSISTLRYGYEYLGNSARLVITPLTDKCYLTLTCALNLGYGGAPSGPAGTGKTETTKDLGKAVAVNCIVFNCSDSIVYETMARFFSGLAQCGAWACFDEFNRIEIEVLSVIAQQILCIQNAIKDQKTEFDFEGKRIRLRESFGVFITMNPGYAGRTELPDNLKALFRPVAMMIPNYALIAEIILFSEGFLEANILARKMVSLYKLSSEQLSKQKHYDFGMRAVKSVLTMAGSLKRKSNHKNEDQVLLKAMKDSNLPKFSADDIPLFENIIKDLFPNLKEVKERNEVLEQNIKKSLEGQSLACCEKIIDKCVQLYEISGIRHGIMLIGNTGTGKTTILNTTLDSLAMMGDQIHLYSLNPKSVTRKELFGFNDPITNSFVPGLVSKVIGPAMEMEGTQKQWFMFDGPVDADWIENLNTVLDDNKMLCLPDGKRIKLPNFFSFLFEVDDLEQASPATVSRCGMIFLDKNNLNPLLFFEHWKIMFVKETEHKLRKDQEQFKGMRSLFEGEEFFSLTRELLVKSFEVYKLHGEEVIKSTHLSLIQNCLNMFQILALKLADEFGNSYSQIKEKHSKEKFAKEFNFKEHLGLLLNFSCVWSFGGNLSLQSRGVFSKHLKMDMTKNCGAMMKDVMSLYDFYYDFTEFKVKNWKELIRTFTFTQENIQNEIMIQTMETTQTIRLMQILALNDKHTFINGTTGVGKSLIVKNFLQELGEEFLSINSIFSAQSSASNFQSIFVEKYVNRGQKLYPANGKNMVFFIDDINMPKLDTYGAQPVNELLRQIIDQKGFYELKKYQFKTIQNTTFVSSCAPPNGGRNPLPQRLMRHFHSLHLTDLSEQSMELIFSSILNGYLGQAAQTQLLLQDGHKIVTSSIFIYNKIVETLLPIPAKIHYNFNLRDLTKVFQGVLQIKNEQIKNAKQLIGVWLHEFSRIFYDRLINQEDRYWLFSMLSERCMKYHAYSLEETSFRNLLFTDIGSENYEQNEDQHGLIGKINDGIKRFNINNGTSQNLVMFGEAVQHLCRLKRVLNMKRGNMILLGLGGSGKQTLVKLAAFLNKMLFFTIELKKNYQQVQWREDMKRLIGLVFSEEENKGIAFLVTSNQIKQDSFLEDINNLINSGEIPNLYSPEEMDEIQGKIKEQCKKATGNQLQNKEEIWGYFVSQVRQKVHVVLTFSPVGDTFRNQCRQFPSLISCSTIDWYDQWSEEALFQVAIQKFAENSDLQLSEQEVKSIAKVSIGVHSNVHETNKEFFKETMRRTYVTPSSYLDFLQLYFKLFRNEKVTLPAKIKKYLEGLKKMEETKKTIFLLQQQIIENQPKIEVAARENAILKVDLEKQNTIAKEKENQVESEANEIQGTRNEVNEMRSNCQRDLDEALPALYKAQEAAKNIDKQYIATIKTYNKVAKDIQMVLFAVNVIFGKKETWEDVKKFLSEMDFLKKLTTLDPMTIPQKTWVKLKKNYLSLPEFNVQNLKEKISEAISTLANYCINMEIYYQKKLIVEPKEQSLKVAEEQLFKVEEKLQLKQDELSEIQQKVQQLADSLQESIQKEEDLTNQQEIAKVQLQRAEQLIEGLKDEAVRWQSYADTLQNQEKHTIGNILVSAANIAYIGPFYVEFRKTLNARWMKMCSENGILIDKEFRLAQVICDPLIIRDWEMNGLPGDDISVENAILVKNSMKWPLMIDPQSQANAWIKKSKKDSGLVLVKPSHPNLLQILENAIRYGNSVLIENVEEHIDSSLDSILMKQFKVVNGQQLIKFNDNEFPFNKGFELELTTKLQNPHYLPEVTIKVNIINFTVTLKGLEDQLLGELVKLEKPELEEDKNNLIKQISSDNKQLHEIQERILKLIVQSEGNLLDNEDLIETLGASEKTTVIINDRMEKAEVTKKDISTSRNQYLPIVEQCSVIYFVICNLKNIDSMYDFSLESFIGFFNKKIQENQEHKDTTVLRVRVLKKYLSEMIFLNICRGLFEKDKLLFVFMVAAKLQLKQKLMTAKQWSFFKVFEVDQKNEQKCPSFLNQKQWNRLGYIELICPNFMNVCSQVKEFGAEFAKIVESETVDLIALDFLPQKEMMTYFEKFILLRILRPELLELLIKDFIKNSLGQFYLDFPGFDLKLAMNGSTKFTPILLILSSGADPSNNLLQLTYDYNIDSSQFKVISLGQGQGDKAKEAIKIAQLNGDWVCLQNCHLAGKWLQELEQILENTSSDCRDEYRLFLTTMPTPNFPVNFLHQSIKITNEPPEGIRGNLRRIYNDFDENAYNDMKSPNITKPLLFCLSIFHTITLERKKYGPMGWNIPYEWMTSDFLTSKQMLELYVESSQDVPFDTLQFLLAIINYGGRITDYNDEKLIVSLLKAFFNQDCLDSEYAFMQDQINQQVYRIPETRKIDDVKKYINQLPFNDQPEIFGLHRNASINLNLQNMQLIEELMLTFEPSSAGGQEGNQTDQILGTIRKFKQMLPQLIPMPDHPSSESLIIFRDQETLRYNNLLTILKSSLNQLELAIQGLSVMSEQIEKIYECFLIQKVPELWADNGFLSTKKLLAWFDNLRERVAFFKNWMQNPEMETYQLGFFFFPQGFVTSVLQTYSRKHTKAIDSLCLETNLLDSFNQSENKFKPADGVILEGLFLQNQKYDVKKKYLVDLEPKVLFQHLPLIWIHPIEIENLQTDMVFPCPVYKTPDRRGTLSTTGHSTNFVMYLDLPLVNNDVDVQLRRGTAIILQSLE